MTRKNNGRMTDGAHGDVQPKAATWNDVDEGEPPACESAETEILVGELDFTETLIDEESTMHTLRRLMFELADVNIKLAAVLSKIVLTGSYGFYCEGYLDHPAELGDFFAHEGISEAEAEQLVAIHQLLSASTVTWQDVEELGWPKLRHICEVFIASHGDVADFDAAMSFVGPNGTMPYWNLDAEIEGFFDVPD